MANKYNIERYPIGNSIIPYGTPLHVTELFLRLLKVVFSELPEQYPYRFVDGDYEASSIDFDVALNKESEIYGVKPIVVVSRGAQSSTPMDIGDYAHGSLPTNFKMGSNLYVASLNYQIVSKTKAEVEIIGQIIFSLLMLRRTHMPKLLGIHNVQSIMLSEVGKMEDDDTMFTAQGGFSYAGQYIWTQTTEEPVLSGVDVKVEKK